MILILAYGNDLRRDDSAGLALGAGLQSAFTAIGIHCRLIQSHQSLPEQAEVIAQPEVRAVIFCDARQAGPSDSGAIEFHRIAADGQSSFDGHSFTPQGLLALASGLYHSSPPAWMVTIPGRDFNHGEGLSRETADMLSKIPTLAGSLNVDLQCVLGD